MLYLWLLTVLMSSQFYNEVVSEQKKKILKFLERNILATISTVNNKTHKPESALIAFAERENLESLFITLKGSRKYVNLLENNHVALVIGWDPAPNHWETMQYEGRAVPIPKEDVTQYKKNLFK